MAYDQPLIVTSLTLFRGETRVLSNVHLSLQPHQICAVRGKNGAGKSSLLGCLSGQITPDKGEISRPETFAWLGHKRGVKARETPRQHIQIWGQAIGAPHKAERDALQIWGLDTIADLPVKFLSQGQTQRTALSRLSLLPQPLWLLDEPFSALDTEGRKIALDQIEAHTQKGGMVVMAIHEDVQLNIDVDLQL